jgi:LPS sulfotransferase NodH
MPGFDQFVVFAEMRTGSNFLEVNINSIPGLVCHGEAFNPRFIGYPNSADILGVTQSRRDADPAQLLDAMKAQKGALGGFRFFNDHDPRVLDIVLPDPRCAKIILTRNPIESYVSRKIAAATGQWKLTNAKNLRSETIIFDAAEFVTHLQRQQDFQVRLMNALQRTGQTAFYVAYEDLQDIEVMNGLAKFLGVSGRIDALDKKLKKQNPEPLEDKVRNFHEMEEALARIDRFNLSRTPNFEPRRGPAIPTYLAAAQSPLLYLPLRSGPEEAVAAWLARLDGGHEPISSFSQKSLRQWKEERPGHRSFTVVRHPLARAHAAFCDRILNTGPGSFPELRENLRRTFSLPLAGDEDGSGWSDEAHHAAFKVFLTFLKANLGGQTNLRVDPAWASQIALLQGIAQFGLPDMILREDRLAADLAMLGGQTGRVNVPDIGEVTDPHAARLARILDDTLQAMAHDIYQRDLLSFGFGDWVPSA